MASPLHQRLAKALDLTDSLPGGLSDTDLARRNGSAPSNTIGEQFWCLVGARESYARALPVAVWQGFDCSLVKDDLGRVQAIQAGLQRSAAQVLSAVGGIAAPNEQQQNLVLDLLEHEAQHHGQLIRYFYANDLAFPEAFAARYSL